MTAKRIAASRANGQHSRGAHTLAGKARVAAVNLRHGFYARAQPEIMLALGEDPAHYEDLLDSLTEIWLPANQMEMRLVVRLARAIWRMERADRIQESLTVEQHHRSMPKPTFLQIVDRSLKDKANKLSSLATEVSQPGHFTSPEDLDLFDEVYGDNPQQPGSDEHAILVSLWRLLKPGTEDAGPVIDGSDPKAEGTLPEDEDLRKAERSMLAVMLLKQIAQIHARTDDGNGEPEEPSHSPYAWDAMMAPQDRNGPIMLMQRWEDSNMRQIVRITEMLTKLKNGKLGWVDSEK
jgi:hypothetical protein